MLPIKCVAKAAKIANDVISAPFFQGLTLLITPIMKPIIKVDIPVIK